MTNENYFKISFPSRSVNESFARLTVASFCMQFDPNIEQMNDIKTAVSEAVTNAIVHGYPEHMGDIQMKVRILSGNVIEIIVRDQGRGIQDVEQARTPMFTTGGEERSGMGFTIMESFMERVKITSKPGKGTRVVMRKSIMPRPSER